MDSELNERVKQLGIGSEEMGWFHIAVEWLKRNVIYIGIYIFFFLVAIHVPFGGDDWEVSNWYRDGAVSTFFGIIRAWSYFTGRIMNNWADSFLSFHRWLWNFTIPFVHTLTLYYLNKLCNPEKKRVAISALAFLMLISVSENIRAETQFHIVGSISYTICICCIFILAWILNMDLDGKLRYPFISGRMNGLLFFILSMSTALWIENLTLGLLALIFCIAVYRVIDRKKFSPILKGCIFGSIFGTIIIFSSVGVGRRIDSTMTMLETIKNNLWYVLNYLVIENVRLFGLCFAIILIAVWQREVRHKRNRIAIAYCVWLLLNILSILVGITLSLCANNYFLGELYNKISSLRYGITGIVWSVLMLGTLFVAVLYARKRFLTILFAVATVSVAPMVLAPGARNMLLAEYIVIGYTVFFASQIQIKQKDRHKIVYIAISVMLLIRMENYAYWLRDAYFVEKTRDAIITEYKVSSMKAENPDDLTLILPVHSGAFIGNLNSTYYSVSIINYYDLDQRTAVLFDDDFLVRDVIISDTYRKDMLECTIDQFLRYGNEYNYLFTILDDNIELVTVDQGADNTVEFIAQEGHSYIVTCDIINITTNKILTVYSDVYTYGG